MDDCPLPPDTLAYEGVPYVPLSSYAALRTECAELRQHRDGHLPTCDGVDEAAGKCACGYLQGTAYRALRAECDALREALRGVIAEADRNTDPFVLARALLAAPRKEGERT